MRILVSVLTVILGFGLALSLEDGANAQQKTLKIGMSLPITGADADGADAMAKGAQMAIDEINAKGGAGGYKFEGILLNSATPAAGQYDAAQAVTNHRQFIADSQIIAAVGPETSGESKAVLPVLSEADMAAITPSATNPDLTDPAFKAQYRPKGRVVYFRMVTTDAYQGPNMTNYASHVLKAKTVYVIDDSGAFGVGISDAFQRRATELGMKVLGRDRVNPKEADYMTLLTKVKALNPDAIFYGGHMQAGVKVARQGFDVMPRVPKLGSDGIYDLAFPEQAGKEAAEGWYATNASPDMLSDPKAQEWINQFKSKFKREPTNYAITAYNGVLVIADALSRLVKDGKPVSRSTVRDYILTTDLKNSLQGPIAFDENGDIKQRTVSVYQVKDGQFTYIGVAPQR